MRLVEFNRPDGVRVFINPAHVVGVTVSYDGNTLIYTAQQQPVRVVEKLDDVIFDLRNS